MLNKILSSGNSEFYCIVLYCIMRPYTDGPIGPLSYKQVQLGPRYEGQLNPMAEPIPHEVRPLVRTHVYHPYHAADRQTETDS